MLVIEIVLRYISYRMQNAFLGFLYWKI